MDGFICVNKAAGPSSGHIVGNMKRLTQSKCGHCGTLDPQATGVLPIAVGKATRLSEFVMNGEKKYIGEICFGIETDSYDKDGRIVQEQDASFVSAEMVQQLLPQFCGEIMQTPPPVSALKQDGEPLYKKIRRGEQVEVQPRPACIHHIALLHFMPASPTNAHPRCQIEVSCAKGVYIRSIAHDLGQLLGCGAHLSALQRTQVGQFCLEHSYTLDQLWEMQEQGDMSFLLPMNEALAHIPAISAENSAVRLLVHGNDAPAPLPLPPQISSQPASAPLRVLDSYGRLLGIGRLKTAESSAPLISMDKVLVDVDKYEIYEAPLVACAIGNFDGLHHGHRALMEELYRKKQLHHGQSAVITFSPHPLSVIRGQAPELLTDDSIKDMLLLDYLGVDRIITLTFDQKLMNSTPEGFIDSTIVPLGVKEVVVGYNFTFAAYGRATAHTLQELCAQRGINVTIIPEISGPYGVYSSTNIRRYLSEGNLQAVNAMLGYWFAIEGKVVRGNQLGRTIGFPTANVLPIEGQAIPQRGVYAGRIVHRGITYDGVINFGVKPTIGGEKKPLVEAYLFDQQLDLYGETICIYFGKFLRPERRFTGIDELKAQIALDDQEARRFLAKISPTAHLPKRIQ